MRVYKSLTLGKLIDLLDSMPGGSFIRGLNPDFHSYRGYYQHMALSPDKHSEIFASDFKRSIEEQIGKVTYGWKGGEFPVAGDSYVFIADEGDTGPALAGFTDEGEPIGFEQGWY